MPNSRDAIKRYLEAIRDERMTAANTATRIGNAFLMLLDYMSADAPYIRKDQADGTSYLLTLLAGAVIGNDAIRLNSDGSISASSLSAEGEVTADEVSADTVTSQDVQSDDFVHNDSGFKISKDANDKYVLEIDIANIRENIEAQTATFGSAAISQVTSPITFQRTVTMLQNLITNVIQSSDYEYGQEGFKIYKKDNDRYVLEISDIEVFGKMVVHELEVREESYSGGNMTYSHAGSHIESVREIRRGTTMELQGHVLHLGGAVDFAGHTLHVMAASVSGHAVHISSTQRLYAYRCFLKADDGTRATENWWRKDDQARCQTFNLDGRGKYQNISNSYYWRRVLGIGSETLPDGLLYDYVDLSAGDAVSGSTVPQAGDDIVQVGNRTDASRQGFISLEVYGDNAPALKIYRNVSGYTLTGKMKICLSPGYTEIRLNKFVIETEYDAQQVPMERGAWADIEGHKCYYYDLVQHNGSTWLCIYPEGGISGIEYTTEEPSDYAVFWRAYAKAGKDGSDGKSFNILGSYDTEAQLFQAHPTGDVGDAYIVAGFLYVWDEVNTTWHNSGKIQGDPGRGIQKATISYGISDSPTAYPSTWVSNPAQLALEQGKWLFTRTILTYTDNTTSDPSYSMGYFGRDGSFKTTAFCRTNQDISSATVTGGTFATPVPNAIIVNGETITFYDGIPDGEKTIWAVSDTFKPDNTHTGWTNPRRMSDTSSFDVEFSPNDQKPADPSDDESARTAQGWYDPDRNPLHDFSTTIWRAERQKRNGVWTNWAVERIKGEKGDPGEAVTVSSQVINYAVSTQGTDSTLVTGWQATIPEVPMGQFLWTRVVTTWSDSTSATVYGVSYAAKDIDVSATSVRYAKNTTGQQPADSEFVYTDLPMLEQGDYLWTKSEVTYSNGKVLKTYSVSRLGTDGDNGDVGPDGYTTHFAYATSADGSQNFSTTNFAGATYIGTYKDQNGADSTDYRDYTWTQWKGNTGEQGPQGPQGPRGPQGESVTVTSSTIEYAVSTQGTNKNLVTGWSTTIPTVPQGQYLWTRVTTSYSDGNSNVVYGVSYNSKDATIRSSSVRYAKNTTGTQPADSAFTYTSIPDLSQGDYLWTKTEVTYSDGTVVKSYDVSRLGIDGDNGTPGADGYTTHFAYATSADGSQNFSTTNFVGATYIGTYRDQTAADSTDYRVYTWTQWKGDKGDQGLPAAQAYVSKAAVFIPTNTKGWVLDDYAEELEVSLYAGTEKLSLTEVTVTEPAPQYVDTQCLRLIRHKAPGFRLVGHVAHFTDIARFADHVTHFTGAVSSFVTAVNVKASKYGVLDEHNVSLSVKGISEDGEEYTGYCSFQLLRQYVAQDGADGEGGEDAIALMLSAPSVILQQSISSPYTIDYSNAYTEVFLLAGGNDITDRATVKTLEKVNCQATYANGRITITSIANGTSYYDQGYVRLVLTYADHDYEVRFSFYANLLGSWKQTVIGDTLTEVANRKFWTYDKDGNPVQQMTEAEYIRSSSINSATLTDMMGNKVDTSTFEQRAGSIESMVRRSTGSNRIPNAETMTSQTQMARQYLSEGTYVFSVYIKEHYGTSYLGLFTDKDSASAERTIEVTPFSSIDADNPIPDYERRAYLSFTLTEGRWFLVAINGNHRYPQVEPGATPTPFNVGRTVSESWIKETADALNAGVQNVDGRVTAVELTADGLSTEVRNGKNMLPVTDSWEGYNGAAATFDKTNFGVRNISGTLYSPAIRLKKGVTYCFSAYMTAAAAAVTNKGFCYGSDYTPLSDLDDRGTYIQMTLTRISGDSIVIGNTTYYRYYCTITATDAMADLYMCFYYGDSYYIYCPQLEMADAPSVFSARTFDSSSQIKQTATDIDASITDKLGETGINISGTNRKITLRADKVTFTNSAGTISNRIWIDPDTGTIHAVDGFFAGFTRKTKTTITPSNISQYTIADPAWGTRLDLDKCGSFIELSGTFSESPNLRLPVLYSDVSFTAAQKDAIRALVGQSVLIYNASNAQSLVYIKGTGTSKYTIAMAGHFVCLQCVLDNSNGYEEIYWEETKQGIII